MLSQQEMYRYKRHLMLPQVDVAGQEKIRDSKVLIVGAGGLGCPVAMQLACAGVGTIGIIDFDVVDLSNLQRQLAYTEQDVGKSKVRTVKNRLMQMNSNICVNAIEDKLDANNAPQIFEKYDIIVDACDNFDTRYLISDTCVKLGKPLVYGAIYEFYGQVVVLGQDGPCLRCINAEPPKPGEIVEACDVGVFGAIPGVVGSMQACEVLKLITGCGETLKGRMVFVDLLNMTFDEVEIPKNPKCKVCGKGENNG
ncbi:MAG: HesA/MoeB/ThiF family protein [Oscillospiraceae bacterium]|nr:HesA/MoeB/ThiF family protein [Oscillospiraceae bacterium]